MGGPWEQYATPETPVPAGPWMKYAEPAAPSTTAAGLAKSLGTGLVQGTVGLPGDISNLLGSGADWAAEKITGEKPKSTPSILPTSESIGKRLYEPQTTAEKYANTVGQFIPAAIGGPETLGAKLTRVVAPAVASETAGQLTAGTAAEPIARIAGAVVAGGRGAGAAKSAIVPTVEELKDAARAGYKHPEVAAVEIRPQAVSDLATKIESDLASNGFRPTSKSASETFNEVRGLNVPPGVQSVKVADIDNARRSLGNLAKEVDAVGKPTTEAAAASRAMGHLDNFLPNLRQPDLLAGDAARANAILSDARSNWGAAKRAEDLGVRLTRAERQAARSGSGSNIDNAVRQKVSAVLDVPSRSVGYSAAEKAQAEKVVRGTTAANALRKVGKLGFNDGLSLLLHAGATLPTGGANIPIGIAGTLARKAAESSTKSQANQLEEMMRSRSALAQQRAAALPAPAPRLTARQQRLIAATLGLPRTRNQNQ